MSHLNIYSFFIYIIDAVQKLTDSETRELIALAEINPDEAMAFLKQIYPVLFVQRFKG